MPINPIARDEQWRVDNADLLEFLNSNSYTPDGYITAMRRWLTTHAALTERQTMASRRIMARFHETGSITREAAPVETAPEATTGYDPAGPMDLPDLFNGTYTITSADNQHLTYKIYTVRNGPLQGQRIVKYSNAYGVFTGFATVMRDGRVQVWRRYRDQANEQWIAWGITLVGLLLAHTPDETHDTERTWTFESNRWTVQAGTFCRACNRALTDPTSIATGIGPDCSRRLSNSTTHADAHASVNNANINPTRTFNFANISTITPVTIFPPWTCEMCTPHSEFLSEALLEEHVAGGSHVGVDDDEVDYSAPRRRFTPRRRPTVTPRTTTVPRPTVRARRSEIDGSWDQ